ncbi:MAG: YkgJ family cysteine cluster protein [Nanoarchaeota archaeon]|nr:YkgJ family cysteine cluster protein [Nanoarchaeota archaeon]
MRKMFDYNCKKTLVCERCGDCCRFRSPQSFTHAEDLSIRKAMYEKAGIIYIYPLDRFTISITDKEKDVFETRAKELKVKVHILPKKVILKEGKIIVLDWFLDHDVCPFLEGTNTCRIYDDRPLICKVFPRTKYSKEEEMELLLMKGDNKLPFGKAVEFVKKRLIMKE